MSGMDQDNVPLIQDIGHVDINEDDLPSEPPPNQPLLPLYKLIALSISFLGVQFGWALQMAYSTPMFLQLGVSRFWVSFIWIAGPVSGLIVQPIVGVISDRLVSKYGRRKPFIFFGSICIVLGLMLISNAPSIGAKMGDTPDKQTKAIILAIIGFWILDLSNNAVQSPCRALLVDVAPPAQQGLGSSLFSIMLGIGNLLGYFMGSLSLVGLLPFMKTDIRILFKSTNYLRHIFDSLRDIPPYLSRVCCTQFFSWIGWFCFVLYVTTWVGVDVYHGNPNAPAGSIGLDLFQEGVRRGSLGLSIQSVVAIASSLLLPWLIRLIGHKEIYFIGTFIQAVCFGLFFFVEGRISCLFLIGATGFSWAVVMVMPFTIVGMGSTASKSGLHIGVMNIFVVVPQLLVSLTISFIIDLFGGDIVISLLTGSVSSFIAALSVLRLIIPEYNIDQLTY
ncbi:hypothetical protein SAMD00019534_043080 [Acytostelium subglobosum LB1]|uniref:hypothetical protein n=1 Tax=Acytostelium subglobosum LB1 TaxID=1410327 RepID=UPI000644A00F|nr:hypothetical protein SAMD00019534_043080 [Acytostelium subglobosum LB1]GAM21133.1 hypothetical protein SAMD00019534_043080 [Acytostelium subglobosum LB1]|eukprot:XP_012756267.1 hypothetical protein SAMD00019534_043080 [Acytostelium subglobosum LB1]